MVVKSTKSVTFGLKWVLHLGHGSTIFTRGETQAFVTATIGTDRDAQHVDFADEKKIAAGCFNTTSHRTLLVKFVKGWS